MKSKIRGQCLLEKVGILKEVVFKEAFLQERLKPFSKNGYIFKTKVTSKENININKQPLRKNTGFYINKSRKMGVLFNYKIFLK